MINCFNFDVRARNGVVKVTAYYNTGMGGVNLSRTYMTNIQHMERIKINSIKNTSVV
jgi:hypothetical protein